MMIMMIITEFIVINITLINCASFSLYFEMSEYALQSVIFFYFLFECCLATKVLNNDVMFMNGTDDVTNIVSRKNIDIDVLIDLIHF